MDRHGRGYLAGKGSRRQDAIFSCPARLDPRWQPSDNRHDQGRLAGTREPYPPAEAERRRGGIKLRNDNFMLSKSEFLERLGNSGADLDGLSDELDDFESISEAAEKAWNAMPGIGFVSVRGRINCFLAVCRHLDSMVEDHLINEQEAQIAIIILSLEDKKFRKAVSMFDLRAPRYRVKERVELPEAAQVFLASAEAHRRW